MKYLKLILLVVVFTGAKSQESMSLSQAIELALANNFQIKIADKQTEAAENNNTWGNAGRYPGISLTLGQNNNLSDQSQNPTSFIQELLVSNSLQTGLNLNWTLFNGFSVSANKEKYAKLVEQSEGNQIMVIENTIQAVILAYYNVLLQKDKLVLVGEVMSLSYDRYQYEVLKKDIGTSSSFELLQYRNALLSDSSNYLVQELAYENALRNLKLLIQLEDSIEVNLSDNLSFDRKDYAFSDLKSKMLSGNQNIKNQYINLEIVKQDIKLSKSQLYPVISFSLGASASSSRFKIADFPAQNGLNINYYGNFSLSYNLFNGGKVKTQVANAKIQEEIANFNLEEAKFNLVTQLKSQHELLVSQGEIYKLSKETFNNSRLSLDIAQDKFKTGLLNSFEYRDVQLSFLNAGISTLESTYNLIDTHTELLRLTGGLVEE